MKYYLLCIDKNANIQPFNKVEAFPDDMDKFDIYQKYCDKIYNTVYGITEITKPEFYKFKDMGL